MKFIATIFTEGDGDVKFLKDFVKLRFGYDLEVGTEILKVSGKDSLHLFKENFKQQAESGFVNLVIFDADDSYNNSKDNLETAKQNHRLDFKFFLFPDNGNPGNLETLLEQIANPLLQPILNCFSEFQGCLRRINNNTIRIPNQKDKMYIYSSLLTSNEDAKDSRRDYTDAEVWNLKSDKLEPLYNFLRPYFLVKNAAV